MAAAHIQAQQLIRLSTILGDKRRGIEPLIPVSRTTWYKGIAAGIYPKPIKHGERASFWRGADIIKLIDVE